VSPTWSAPLGYKRVMEFLPYAVGYGAAAPEFWIQRPLDQRSASAGNGTHVAFTAKNQKAVHAFHEAALAAGAKDEGAPGPRPEYSPDYYCAFVRDSEGNKIEAVFFAMAQSKPAKTRKAARRKGKPARKTAKPARKATKKTKRTSKR
jgi:hypothetical protein